MALILCPECNNKISNKAPACVHCGLPSAYFEAANAVLDSAVSVATSRALIYLMKLG